MKPHIDKWKYVFMLHQETDNKVIPPSSAIEFFRVLGRLKTLKRTGWVNHRVNLPESVADHMYRMSVMAMLIVDSRVDRDKLVKSNCMRIGSCILIDALI